MRATAEAPEQARHELLGHAGPVVAHLDLHTAGLLGHIYLDRWGSVGEGVLQVVDHHLRQLAAICQDPDFGIARYVHVSGPVGELGQSLEDHLQHRHRLHIGARDLRVDLRHGEELLDQGLETGRAIRDAAEDVGSLLLGERLPGVTQHVHQLADPRQRVADLMSRHGDHRALAFEFGFELLFGLPPECDVAQRGDVQAFSCHRRGGGAHLDHPRPAVGQH